MLAVLAGLASGLALYDRAGVWSFAVMVPVMYSAVMFSSYEGEIPGQWPIFLAGLAICAVCSARFAFVLARPAPQNITLTQATGTVSAVRSWGRQYVMTVDADNGKSYVVRLPFAEYMQGTRIKFDGATRSFTRNGTFDEGRYWGARGVTSWLSIYNVEELGEKFSFARFRYRLSKKLTMYFPEKTASYLKAMWLGERDKDLNDKHTRWGTVHLLAVSGFHVGIVVLCASLIFGENPVVMSLIMWLYVLLTGAAPSALRAGLMFQAGLIAKGLGRPASGVNSVSLAGVMILMWSPLMFWDVGFRLSMLCALTITTIPRRYWLCTSPILFLVSFPQVSYSFGSVVVVGILLNLIAPLYFTFAFTIASAVGVLRFIGLPLIERVIFSTEGIFLLWERVADFAADLLPYAVGWNYAVAWVGSGTLAFCLCRYFGLAPLRVLAVMIAGSLLAFMMFM